LNAACLDKYILIAWLVISASSQLDNLTSYSSECNNTTIEVKAYRLLEEQKSRNAKIMLELKPCVDSGDYKGFWLVSMVILWCGLHWTSTVVGMVLHLPIELLFPNWNYPIPAAISD
jgi:hypothetical protein